MILMDEIFTCLEDSLDKDAITWYDIALFRIINKNLVRQNV